MAAHEILHRYSKTMPSEALHKAVGFVIEDAKDHTPVTSQSRIDTELSVTTTPIVRTPGVKKGATNITIDDPKSKAMMIAISRMHRNSRYSQWTDNRWPVAKPNTHGARAFLNYMEQVAERMIRGRHSSTGFFKISWNPLLAAIANFVPGRFKAHFLAVSGQKSGNKLAIPPGMGTFTPAKPNSTYAICKIENNVGMDETYPTIAARRNEAAHRILGPVLQGAIDRNFDEQMELAAKRGLLDHAAALKALGVIVS